MCRLKSARGILNGFWVPHDTRDQIVDYVVKKGAAHGWLELGKDTHILADWFDKHLAK